MQKRAYGRLADGTPVEEFTLVGKGGLSVTAITYGAIITHLCFGGKDVVLGQTCLEDYVNGVGAIGITVGRFANRIANGRFTLNGKEYDVGCNEKGRGHLHGGTIGFDKHVWSLTALDDHTASLRLISPDGDMGYPGTMTVDLTFAVEVDNTLTITYRAVSDKDTVINLTNHAYFNLNGYDGGDVLDTVLQINADSILPVDDLLIPTGKRLAVAGTPFDFREPKAIGREIDSEHPQMVIGGGYDHNFCLGDERALRHAVSAYSPRSGIRMDCYTDQPGVQLYTANFLDCDHGKGGAMTKHQGFCLETQHFPYSPNQPSFPTTTLHAGDVFESVTQYRFTQE